MQWRGWVLVNLHKRMFPNPHSFHQYARMCKAEISNLRERHSSLHSKTNWIISWFFTDGLNEREFWVEGHWPYLMARATIQFFTVAIIIFFLRFNFSPTSATILFQWFYSSPTSLTILFGDSTFHLHPQLECQYFVSAVRQNAYSRNQNIHILYQRFDEMPTSLTRMSIFCFDRLVKHLRPQLEYPYFVSAVRQNTYFYNQNIHILFRQFNEMPTSATRHVKDDCWPDV